MNQLVVTCCKKEGVTAGGEQRVNGVEMTAGSAGGAGRGEFEAGLGADGDDAGSGRGGVLVAEVKDGLNVRGERDGGDGAAVAEGAGVEGNSDGGWAILGDLLRFPPEEEGGGEAEDDESGDGEGVGEDTAGAGLREGAGDGDAVQLAGTGQVLVEQCGIGGGEATGGVGVDPVVFLIAKLIEEVGVGEEALAELVAVCVRELREHVLAEEIAHGLSFLSIVGMGAGISRSICLRMQASRRSRRRRARLRRALRSRPSREARD
jgi:hypothetical protein